MNKIFLMLAMLLLVVTTLLILQIVTIGQAPIAFPVTIAIIGYGVSLSLINLAKYSIIC